MSRDATPEPGGRKRKKRKRRERTPPPESPVQNDVEDGVVLSEQDAGQLRARLMTELEFWESAGGIPTEYCEEIEGSILLLEGRDREALWGTLERLKGSPPRAPSPPPPQQPSPEPSPKRARAEPEQANTEEAAEGGIGMGGVPVPPVQLPKGAGGGTAGRIDARKMSEISIEGLQQHMDPTLRIKSVLFVCALDPIPEYSDDEAEEPSDNPTADGSATARYKTIPPTEPTSSLLLLCTDYLEYTPAPWLETVAVDDIAVQCVVLSMNGNVVETPANWKDRGEASNLERFKTFPYARLPCREGFLGVQFAEGMTPWRACLIGVEVQEIAVEEYVKEVAARGVSSRPWDDEGLETTSVSLKCPLTQQRMVVPARGAACAHPECFDLASFLTMSSSLHSWSCPICDSTLPPSQLIVDPLLQNVITSTSAESVWVSRDGTWEVPEKKKSDVEVIELD